MPRYNDLFELSVEDMELIEEAMRHAISARSVALVDEGNEDREARENFVRKAHELLGRLHDQKIFYRPKSGVYVSG
ncbi:hypothetical protein [Ruegeria conchae]|uniref:Uncharacterized protein n=1 Tax=Ruegeria conchae TaxID=981384 RepID=A0A497ZRQ0_9RHOB|nr:hypothetical protein [Ruegeria conchae]RLK10462.1 hypothetical protein CLV75_0432 [Ruegeria conchae]